MESRWIWRVLAVPGVVWLSVFFLVAMYAVLCVALGNQNTLNQPVPYWNPLDWNVGYLLEMLRNIWHNGPFLKVFLRTSPSSRSRWPLAPDRLPGRLLRGAPRRPLARARAAAARPAVLDQLPDAHAGLDQPALARRLGHALPARLRHRGAVREARAAEPGRGLAQRPGLVGRDRARLRLHPVPDPAAVRRARPHRPAPHRGRARPRREPVRGVPARHAAALGARDPRGHRADRPADVRRLLHAGPDLGLAAHEHDRQPDRPVHPAGLAEDGRAPCSRCCSRSCCWC